MIDPAVRAARLSRRRFLASLGVTAAGAWLAPPRLFASEDEQGVVQTMRKGAAAADLKVEKLRGNISVLSGSGGNIAVLPGPDGKLLVDSGLAGSRPRISAALASISPDPVRRLINTHWHFDHTDGNEWLHSEGAEVIAHENTHRRLSASTRVDAWDFTFPPAPSGALPEVRVTSTLRLPANGMNIAVRTYAPCHTDTDLIVEFGEADVIHLGDTWWNGHYPFIDYSTGGSIDGMIRAAEDSLTRGGKETIFIPGHGPAGDRAQLTEFRDLLASTRESVAALKKQGRTLDEIIAARPTAAHDARWGGFVINPETFVRLVHQGV